MRILGMLRATPGSEAGEPPTKELIERMGAFVGEAVASGVLIGGDGLLPSATGKRVKLQKGRMSVIDGPFTETKELIASYALFEVASMEDAVHWTRRFLEVIGEGECELRVISEPEDFPPELMSEEVVAREEENKRQMERNAARR